MRVLALGNADRGDDGAALAVAARLGAEVSVIMAGRPGSGLLDLLPEDDPCVLLDVTCSGALPGTVRRIPLNDLTPDILPDLRISSHGFGPGEALALARALGRALPKGCFLGIEGERFDLGEPLSASVSAGLDAMEAQVREVIAMLAAS